MVLSLKDLSAPDPIQVVLEKFLEKFTASMKTWNDQFVEAMKQPQPKSDTKHDRKVLICGYMEEEDCFCVATEINETEYDLDDKVDDVEFDEKKDDQNLLQIQQDDEPVIYDVGANEDVDNTDQIVSAVGDRNVSRTEIEDSSPPIHQVCVQSTHDKVSSLPKNEFSSLSLTNNTVIGAIDAYKEEIYGASKAFDEIPEPMGYIVTLNPKPPDDYGQFIHGGINVAAPAGDFGHEVTAIQFDGKVYCETVGDSGELNIDDQLQKFVEQNDYDIELKPKPPEECGSPLYISKNFLVVPIENDKLLEMLCEEHGGSYVWVDHCSLSNCQDGLIDAIMGSTAITISNNYMTHHDKVMLLGHSDSYGQDKNMQITIAFNHFGEVQRMPRCDVCKNFISTNMASLIVYRAHPFWVQKYCPSHEHDGTPRCCSCERMEPPDTRYLLVDDGGKLCLECLDSDIMDTHECQPLYLEIKEFFEGLNMKLEQQIPKALGLSWLQQCVGSNGLLECVVEQIAAYKFLSFSFDPGGKTLLTIVGECRDYFQFHLEDKVVITRWGNGAGIQADLKTYDVRGVYCSSVITAVTAQNTVGVQDVNILLERFVSEQLKSVLSDMHVDVVKTGMLPSIGIVKVIYHSLKEFPVQALVVDPVRVSTSGDVLAGPSILDTFREQFFPMADIVTPNVKEATALIGGMKLQTVSDMCFVAKSIHDMGPRNVLVKGGDLPASSNDIDIFFDGEEFYELRSPRIQTRHTHGTGCTLASYITAELAKGSQMLSAVKVTKHYVETALDYSKDMLIGNGLQGPFDHLFKLKRNVRNSNRQQALDPSDLFLYAMTDSLMNSKWGRSITDDVKGAIEGGATIVQLREKDTKTRNFLGAAKGCLEICRYHGVPLLINDRIDIALACNADGVHVGQSDMPVHVAHSLLGREKIIGESCKTPEQAHQAWVNGGDYIGCGGVYPTNTKANNPTLGLDGLKTVCLASKLPVVAIGGIGVSNARAVKELGLENLKGVAVVSALFDRECVLSEVQKLHANYKCEMPWDVGYFLSNASGSNSLGNIFSKIVQLHEYSVMHLSPSCTSKMNASLCFYPENIIVRYPHFYPP